MYRLVPPAGIPVSFFDIYKIIGTRLSSGKSRPDFVEIVKEISGAKFCWLVNSGRAANYIILKSLRDLSDDTKNEVVIPAYTCFSVPASIAKAGLKIRIVDINSDMIDYDFDGLNKIDFAAVLAILPVNLFGIVSDWSRLRNAMAGKNVFLVDDSAQTLGLSYDGVRCGSLGDIGFFSFGRGKNLTTYSGGAIVTNDDKIAEQIERNARQLQSGSTLSEIRLLTEFLFYAIMMRPWLYWIPDRLPFLGLGKTEYDESFSVESLSQLQKAIGPVVYANFRKIIQARIDNSNRLAREISAIGGYAIPGWSENAAIPYIRLPILTVNESVRNRAITELRRRGIGASAMYPSAINEIPQIGNLIVNLNENFEGARMLSRRLFTLPTHAYLSTGDIESIIMCLRNIGA